MTKQVTIIVLVMASAMHAFQNGRASAGQPFGVICSGVGAGLGLVFSAGWIYLTLKLTKPPVPDQTMAAGLVAISIPLVTGIAGAALGDYLRR